MHPAAGTRWSFGTIFDRFTASNAKNRLTAAGNTAGNREILEYAAATLDSAEPMTDVAAAQGWSIASMRRDWALVFDDDRVSGS